MDDYYLKSRHYKRAYRMWNNARQRAKARDIEFTITLEWVEDKLAQGQCEVTSIPFDMSFQRIWSPSLDKIDPERGYTPDNTQITVFIYNSAKLNGSHEDVVRFARAIVAANDNQKP
jgi:hypothetical protein